MKKLLNVWAFTLCLFTTITVFAEIPSGYYDRVEGTKKEALKTALSSTIQPTKVLKYGGSGDGYTWAGFYYTDRLSNGYVLDRYSNQLREFPDNTSVSGMHIEHSFANSWWGGIKNNAYKDLHHLYPADGSANITKSNHPIGIVTENGGFDNGMIKVGLSNCYRSDTLIKVWEPADMYKGDFARTYLYMVTCYEDYSDLWTSEGTLMLENNTYPVLRPWAIELLLKWNHDDPVSELEKNRNEEVFKIQGNRNPFIDYPQLAEYIWGDKMTSQFYTTTPTSPVLFVPQNESTIDFGLQATNHIVSKNVVLQGANLTSDLTVTISDNLFSANKLSFTAAEINNGATLVLSCNSSIVGDKAATMTLTFDNISTTVNLTASFIDGIPAHDATNIVIGSSSSFTANWESLPGMETVNLDVYTKDGDNIKTSISGFPKPVTGNSLSITGLKPETTYYYMVSFNNVVSNEITVTIPAIPPVISTSPNVTTMAFFTKPNKPSHVQVLGVSLFPDSPAGDPVTCSTELPFEISSDNENWSQSVTITGRSKELYVRMGTYSTEATCEAELLLAAEGAEDVMINLASDISVNNAFFENFELGSKSKYTAADVNCTAANWNMDNVLIGTLANDKKNDIRSMRMKGTGVATMTENKEDGLGKLSFYAGPYGSDKNMSLTVDYSIDNGINWISVIKELPMPNGDWSQYSYTINTDKPARLRFTAVGSTSARVNVDDIRMTDYPESSSVNEIYTPQSTINVVGNNIKISTDISASIMIYDTLGRVVQTASILVGENLIPLQVSKGCYFVAINGTQVHKFVVE